MRRRALVLAASAVLCSRAGAEAPLQPLPPPTEPAREEIVVSASRRPHAAGVLPSSVTILPGERVDAELTQGLSDVLRFVSGLHLAQEGGRGGNAALYLRGLDPNHVVVLVDGVRLNDATNVFGGSFDPTTLSTLEIERVEIVRGPNSAVYGSDAIAGAINVITRRADADEEPSFLLDGGGGRFGSGKVAASARTGAGFGGVSLAAGYDTNNDDASGGGYEGFNAKATLDTALPLGTEIRSSLRFDDSRAESLPIFSGGDQLAENDALEVRDATELSGAVRLTQPIGERLSLELQADHAHRWSERDSPVVTVEGIPQIPPTLTDDEYGRTHLAGLIGAVPLPGLDLTLGGDVSWEAGRGDSDYIGFGRSRYDEERRVGGLFVESLYEFGFGASLSASVRGDFPDDHPTEWSPAAGATLDIPATPVVLYGSWGEGFKLPSFYSLYDTLVGDPDLDAEHSSGWEVGLRGSWLTEALRARLTYFDVEVRDLIDFDSNGFTLVNRPGKTLSRGVEADFDWAVCKRLAFGGSVTFNRTKIEQTRDELRNRPRWRGDLRIAGEPIDGLSLGLRALFVGEVWDASRPTGAQQVKLDAYQRLDFTASYTLRQGLELWLVIDNLLDADYQEAVGFSAPGIYPRAGARLRF